MSLEFEIKRSSDNAVAVWLLSIHFDAFFDIPAKDFYFSSTENIDFPVDGVETTFRGRLMKDVPKGRHQKERGGDYAEFSFINSGNATYQEFKAYEQTITRGKVQVFHCLELDKGYYEGETVFVGYLKDFTVSESDKSLRFTATSDMSRTGFPVGARILTRERCGAEFSYGGTFPPDAYRPCTWQIAQGGNRNLCTRFLKGVDGCIAHNNPHQFYAVTALSTATISFVPSGEIGFPYENNPCFTENNFVCDADWNIYPISFAKVDTIIKANDIRTGKPIDAEILEVFTHIVDEYEIASFDSGAVLEPTAKHLFKVGNSQYAPVDSLVGQKVLGCGKDKQNDSTVLEALQTVHKRTTVYHLHTTANTYIVTDKDASFYFDTHNQKSHIPVNL